MIDLLVFPAVAALMLALITGPLGCFVVWQRMAYFGDTVAHSSLIGVALGLAFGLGMLTGLIVSSTLIAVAVASRNLKNAEVSMDTRLGVFAHGSLAVGLIIMTTLPNDRIDLMSILMGDLLTVTIDDLWILGLVVITVLSLILSQWRRLLMLTIDEDLASLDQINPALRRRVLVLGIALAIAVGVKLVGALLISALLIIPAVAARQITSSPESMAIWATLNATLSSLIGLGVSAFYDTPAGPSIVCAALSILILSTIINKLTKH